MNRDDRVVNAVNNGSDEPIYDVVMYLTSRSGGPVDNIGARNTVPAGEG